jgi:hypothetical protein
VFYGNLTTVLNTSATVEHISNGKHNCSGQGSGGGKHNSSGQGNSGSGKRNSSGQDNSGGA